MNATLPSACSKKRQCKYRFNLHEHSSSLRHTILLHILRYEIYLDEVKPKDLSVNFLQEFMDLPLSYLAPGAAVKFRKLTCSVLFVSI